MKMLLDFLKNHSGLELEEFGVGDIWAYGNDEKEFRAFLKKHGRFLTAFRKNPEKIERDGASSNLRKLRRELVDQLNWHIISESAKMDDAFLERFEGNIVWENLSSNSGTLTLERYKKYKDKLDLNKVASTIPLPESFLEENIDRIHTHILWRFQDLSEAFIEKHLGLGLIDLASRYQKISLSFVKKHEALMGWDDLSMNKHLSKEIVEEYADRLDLNLLAISGKLPYEVMLEHIDRVNLELYLSQCRSILTEKELKQLENIVEMQKSFGLE